MTQCQCFYFGRAIVIIVEEINCAPEFSKRASKCFHEFVIDYMFADQNN